ncbi:TRAP transporter small permease [Halomonas cerina]|uniref:TRAP transporter small permease protein n=1 Tax=Halomonas cerina TaxID=447424 RepID=A0A839V8E0_9GAMM|nr:TRAP transporter small permease [Halomonas cerina]MBB3191923.1 TRAP-type C4-dicarboxylate transport system permease small subunit [Halomonas cerina]
MPIQSVITVIASLIERIASLSLSVITLLIFVAALSRYLFASSIPDAHAIASLLLGIAILWGLGSTTWRDDHIAVDLVWHLCPAWLRRGMDILAHFLVTVFVVVLAWVLFGRVETILHAGQTTSDLQLPLWPFYGAAWLGMVSASVLAVVRLVLLMVGPEGLPSVSIMESEPGER